MEKKIKVGLIQQSNTNDIHANMQRLKANIEDCASKGAQLVVLQELHNSLYFARQKIHGYLILPKVFQVHLPVFSEI